MTKRIEDIRTQDPFEVETEETSMAQDVANVYMDKAKDAAGDYAMSTVKRLLWSIPLFFSLANEYQKDRILNKLERGQKVGKMEFFFGEKPSLWAMIRSVIFLIIVIVIIVVLIQNGLLEMLQTQTQLSS